MEEIVINIADKIYVWPREKPDLKVLDTFVGRLILTNRRLLFLSTGTSGVEKRFTTSLVLGPLLGQVLGDTKTKYMDLSALQNKGSLSLELKDVRSCEVKRRRDLAFYMKVIKQNFIGEVSTYSFMTRYGFKKKWMEKFRDDLLKAKMDSDQVHGSPQW